jgi:predicted DsbA family dithiol-disulfide isomerase
VRSNYLHGGARRLDGAAELGVRGVPFVLFDGKYVLSGAQPIDKLLEALTIVRDARKQAVS